MFEEALKMKLRFKTDKGLVSTEDLFDLPLETGPVNLNGIAKVVFAELNASNLNFVSDKKDDVVGQLKFDILLHVIKTKKDELLEKQQELINKSQKDKLLNLISEKEDDSLKELSLEELKKMANGL